MSDVMALARYWAQRQRYIASIHLPTLPATANRLIQEAEMVEALLDRIAELESRRPEATP